ncbi:hypothetical protein LJB42_000523 [Komagataella kurtzmanii]|nr:hypothetical protein LJB42_000523 [Komagataella kurtzmanii]
MLLDTSPSKPHSNNHEPLLSTPKKASHRIVFGSVSPNAKRNSIFEGKDILSPNIDLMTWSSPKRHQASQKLPDFNGRLGSADLREPAPSGAVSSTSGSPRKLQRASTTDRYIPNRHTASGRLCMDESRPPPSALPALHLEAETKRIYKHSVAEACGLQVGKRILQFQPNLPPPSLQRSTSELSAFADESSQSATSRSQPMRTRKVPSCSEKVLDAPGVFDDFYLSLMQWSSINLLAIALENAVYVWNAATGAVTSLTECSCIVTSVNWSQDGYYLSIGTNDGSIEVWDIETQERLRTMQGHISRVATQDWSGHILTAGSRNGSIVHHDVRVSQHIVSNITNAHAEEICGLSWRSDGQQLATGGNDNVVSVWDLRSNIPRFSKHEHKAAVKAISWSPDKLSLLATGGGSADKHIHFWNTATGCKVNSLDAGSQISSLHWGYSNTTGREIVATHGYPNNSISIYSYPTLHKTGVINDAHDARILNSALSPDGTTLATVAADESLKFWKLFDINRRKSTLHGFASLKDDANKMGDSFMIR